MSTWVNIALIWVDLSLITQLLLHLGVFGAGDRGD
jgi:hypothetical protein